MRKIGYNDLVIFKDDLQMRLLDIVIQEILKIIVKLKRIEAD